jgi:signal transduction histidine kinase
MRDPETLAGALQSLTEALVRLMRADRGAFILLDWRERRVQHFARGGAGWTDVMATVSFDELSTGLTGWALRTGEVALSPGGIPDPRESEAVRLRRRQTNSGGIVVVPVGPRDDRLGTLTLINRPDQPDFTEADAQALRHYAVFVAQAVRLRLARDEAAGSRADADAALRSKLGFLSNLSHELRTPLNGILGFSNLLAASPLGEDQRTMVATIQASGQRLLGTVDNILELARFEAGQFRLETLPFAPRTVLEVAMEPFRVLAAEKKLGWTTVVAPEVPEVVEGDAVRLGQAWSHLLSNAVKFTSSGSIGVHLGARASISGACELTFEVEDTGIGVDDETSLILSAFHQHDDSLTRKFGGTGLGLALCDRIVRAMGGEISLRGKRGVGTTVLASVVLGRAGFTAAGGGEGLRVLLLEPAPDHGLALVKLLEEGGHRVDLVSTVARVRERLAGDDYEAVLLDAATNRLDLEDLGRTAAERGTHLIAVVAPGSSAPDEAVWTAQVRVPVTAQALRSALEKCLFRKLS